MPPAHARPVSRRRWPASALPAGTSALLCVLALLLVTPEQPTEGREDSLRIDDAAFWRILTDFSEPDGYFHSDNLVSNELAFQRVIPTLRQVAADGAYLGVGPDQNFTYLVALQPRIAFIIDVRRQNALLHLLYKAILELAPDRAEFLSRLFSRRKPGHLGRGASAAELVSAFANQPPDPRLHALSDQDQAVIRDVYDAFHASGPETRYTVRGMDTWAYFPTYGELVQTTDESGENHGYLASEDHYKALRRLQELNLVVPLVGDFAGTRAIRAVARFLDQRRLRVAAFYTSNVEFYLFRNSRWEAFAENLALLPVNDRSYVIRTSFHDAYSYGYAGNGLRLSRTLLEPIPDLIEAFNGAQIRTYQDVLERSR
jgi:hypothetical protein